MKFGVSVLAGALIGTLVFILYQDSRTLTAFITGISVVGSTLALQMFAENQKLKEKVKVKTDGR